MSLQFATTKMKIFTSADNGARIKTNRNEYEVILIYQECC